MLTRSRAKALWGIAPRTPVTQRDLADALKVSPRNVTTLVDALENDGFVLRKAHALHEVKVRRDAPKRQDVIVEMRGREDASTAAATRCAILIQCPACIFDVLSRLDVVAIRSVTWLREGVARPSHATEDGAPGQAGLSVVTAAHRPGRARDCTSRKRFSVPNGFWRSCRS